MVGRFCGDDPYFGDFQSDWVPILYLNKTLINPFFLQKKIGLPLSHLVTEILGPKVDLILYQNVLFSRF